MAESGAHWNWAEWATRLGVAAWVRSPSGNLCAFSSRAEELLGVSREEVLGRPCHDVVAARDASGNPFCHPGCPILQESEGSVLPDPLELSLHPQGKPAIRVRLIVLPFESPEGTYLLHCAVHEGREWRALSYLEAVAQDPWKEPIRCDPPLTIREREVLEELTHTDDLYAIAAKLGRSHATIRNHVQHILGKMDVHSVHQAVAAYVVHGSVLAGELPPRAVPVRRTSRERDPGPAARMLETENLRASATPSAPAARRRRGPARSEGRRAPAPPARSEDRPGRPDRS